jgi:hypothetical protein
MPPDAFTVGNKKSYDRAVAEEGFHRLIHDAQIVALEDIREP